LAAVRSADRSLGCLRVAMIAAERDQKAARRQGIAEIRTTQQG
jgi:hypothetical protein